jgi:plasmid stabilization system protein ParE
VARVRVSRRFRAQVAERLAWLAEHRAEEQLEHFAIALEQLRRSIGRYPAAAPVVRRDERHVLRYRLFPRPLPYLLYYGHGSADPIREVILLALFGSGQDRAEVDRSEWPW